MDPVSIGLLGALLVALLTVMVMSDWGMRQHEELKSTRRIAAAWRKAAIRSQAEVERLETERQDTRPVAVYRSHVYAEFV